MFYIYILYSPLHNKYYVGYTGNYQERLIEHNSQENFNTYTSKFRPWIIAAVFEGSHFENEAIGLERFIKKQKSRKLIIKLIDSSFIPTGTLAQLVRVPYVRD